LSTQTKFHDSSLLTTTCRVVSKVSRPSGSRRKERSFRDKPETQGAKILQRLLNFLAGWSQLSTQTKFHDSSLLTTTCRVVSKVSWSSGSRRKERSFRDKPETQGAKILQRLLNFLAEWSQLSTQTKFHDSSLLTTTCRVVSKVSCSSGSRGKERSFRDKS
jgi:hypothetical protein